MSSRTEARIGQFADVREVLDQALLHGGGVYTLASRGMAVHWRQRAYKFRKLYAEAVDANSPYERLTFPQIAPESHDVVIKLIGHKGVFKPSATPTTTTGDIDPLLSEALNAAKNLGLEDL